jgi:hypothetical protein
MFRKSSLRRRLLTGCFGNRNEVHRRSARPAFTQEMLRSSRTCLILCFDLSPVNDVLVWMFYENFLLTSIISGYTGKRCRSIVACLCAHKDIGPPTWRRLGELATMIYALGIHKESSGSSLPTFILETRRRVFCSAYTADKTVSTFLGRPLRISKKHTDIKLPLDLSDEDLTSDDAIFQMACQSLGEDGWNLNGRYYRASWNVSVGVCAEFLLISLTLCSACDTFQANSARKF